jgi:di/tricarboxylate transporter
MIPQYTQQIVVVGLLLILFILIYRETIKPAIGFLLVVVFFQFFGILTAQEILSGFSNQSIASIILLILISTGLRKNYPIEAAFDAIFQKASSYKGFMGRMMALVAVVSSFINNTPVVAPNDALCCRLGH